MPLPAIPAAIAALFPTTWTSLTAWVAGAVAVGKLSNSDVGEMKRAVFDGAVKAAAVHGVGLDPEDPFSDASLSAAFSERTGIAIRTMRDKRSIEDDMLAWAAVKLQERTGLQIRNLRDVNSTRMDVIRFAGYKVSEHTGVPLTDITDPVQTKQDLKDWALSQAYEHMASDAGVATAMFQKSGVDVDAVVKNVNQLIREKDGAEPLSAKAVVMAMLNNGMVQQIARIGAKAVLTSMKTRRQLQMQAASMRFRERHGSRMKYERVEHKSGRGKAIDYGGENV